MSIKLALSVYDVDNSILQGSEKQVLARLALFGDDGGESIYPSYNRISNDMGLSKRSIIRVVNRLISKGFLKKTKRQTEKAYITNFYAINLEFLSQHNKQIGGSDTMSLGGDTMSLGSDCMTLGVVTPCHYPSDPMTLGSDTMSPNSNIKVTMTVREKEKDKVNIHPSEPLPVTVLKPLAMSESDFYLFKDAYPIHVSNLKKTRQAFFEFLPKSLEEHKSSFEHFMKAVSFYREDVRKRQKVFKDKFEDALIMEAHNFILKLKWRDQEYLDIIHLSEARHRSYGVLDEKLHTLLKERITPQQYQEHGSDIHLLCFEKGEPKWRGNTNILTICEMTMRDIVQQIKQESAWQMN